MTNRSFDKQVWDTLSRIDTVDHVDQIKATAKRPAVTYLSWSKAWLLVKREFPGTTYVHKPVISQPDGTMEVEIDVVISDGTDNFTTTARLAVMDNYFSPIPHPTARQLNDSRQRALVKALAFAGLALNLWSDSVIPVGVLADPIDPNQVDVIEGLIKSTGTDVKKFLVWCEADSVEQIPVERYSSAVALLEAKAKRSKPAPKAAPKAKAEPAAEEPK